MDKPLVILVMVMVLLLVTYSIITFISHHFLSKSIELIKQKLEMSQIIASITLLATANCLPDLLLSQSSDSNVEGSHFILATVLADFIFSMTLTIAYVIYRSAYDFDISSKNLNKELVSYLIAIFLIIYHLYFKEGFDYQFIY
jgi:Ca2+/Na+ antiporter